MYILNRRRKRTRSLLAVSLVLVGLGIGAFIVKGLLKTETTIGPPPAAVVSHVYDKRPAPKRFDERLFTFELPGDWEAFKPAESIAGTQSWRNTAGSKGVRVVTVYTDAAVQELAVNRILPVQVVGEKMSVAGDLSDNCVNFTKPTGTGKVQGKWQGVEFLCDTGNYVRNVAGVGAAGGINSVKLTGPTAGQHSIFITYTDNSPNPDYEVFTAMVQSFRLK
jgi:hypothetical protein